MIAIKAIANPDSPDSARPGRRMRDMRYKETGIILLLCLCPAILVGATGPEIALDRSEHDFGDSSGRRCCSNTVPGDQ